jgi:ribosomal protein S18 acetylase RimI-like enzyme
MSFTPTQYRLNTTDLIVNLRNYDPQDWQDFKWARSDYYKSAWEWAYRRQQLGEIEMLVGEINQFCVARIWPDFTKKKDVSVGILWSLDVIPCLRNMGIGSWLIGQGEQILAQKNMRVSEIRVEKKNEAARRLYQRTGYQIVGETKEQWNFQSGDGQTHTEHQDCWILQKAL